MLKNAVGFQELSLCSSTLLPTVFSKWKQAKRKKGKQPTLMWATVGTIDGKSFGTLVKNVLQRDRMEGSHEWTLSVWERRTASQHPVGN